MPFYDYYCEANEKTVEVFHGMKVRLRTWQDVCAAAGIPLGSTPAQAPVIRLAVGATPTTFRLKGLDKDAPSHKLEL